MNQAYVLDELKELCQVVRLAGLTVPAGALVVVERHGGFAKNDARGRLRGLLAGALRDPQGLVTPPKGWPPQYAARRFAWHVLDHLWEIEDESEPL